MNILAMTVKVVGREYEGNIMKDYFRHGSWETDEEQQEFVQYLRLKYYVTEKHEESRKLEVKEGDSDVIKAVIIGETNSENILRDARSEYLYFFKEKWGKLPSFRKQQ